MFNSNWANPVVIVTKQDGSPRLCIDSRKLDSVAKKSTYPLPRIDVILN